VVGVSRGRDFGLSFSRSKIAESDCADRRIDSGSILRRVALGCHWQTTDIAALALVQPLHGFTFALLHLATMRVIGDTVPRALAATAQTVYGVVAVGGTIAVLTLLSGWLYARFGPAGFWAMGTLCTAAFPVIWLLHQALPTSLARVKTCTPAGHLAGERRGGLC